MGAAAYGAVLDALHQVVPDQLARIGFLLKAGPQLRRFDVGAMAGLLRPGPRRVVRPAPAVLVVERVAQRVEGFCQPGGAMLRLRPVSRSHCAARTCTCTPPPCSRCTTAVQQ